MITGPVAWTASPSAAVARVEFYVDQTKVWQENAAPYECMGDGQKWDPATVANGAHALKAVATAADGTQASVQASVTVTVATPVPPQPTTGGLAFPAKFHIWGGNEADKALVCDFVVCSFTSGADPRVARQTNPSVKMAAHPSLDPFNADWTKRGGFAWTYGDALTHWTGASAVRCCRIRPGFSRPARMFPIVTDFPVTSARASDERTICPPPSP